MPLSNPPLKSTQAYMVTNNTPTRSIDATGISQANAFQVLATLIADLKAAGILQ